MKHIQVYDDPMTATLDERMDSNYRYFGSVEYNLDRGWIFIQTDNEPLNPHAYDRGFEGPYADED